MLGFLECRGRLIMHRNGLSDSGLSSVDLLAEIGNRPLGSRHLLLRLLRRHARIGLHLPRRRIGVQHVLLRLFDVLLRGVELRLGRIGSLLRRLKPRLHFGQRGCGVLHLELKRAQRGGDLHRLGIGL